MKGPDEKKQRDTCEASWLCFIVKAVVYYNKIENTAQNFYRKVKELTNVEEARKKEITNALQKPDKQLFPKFTDK